MAISSQRYSPFRAIDDTDPPRRRAISRLSLSSRGKMALLWASILALFGWLILDSTILSEPNFSSPPPPPPPEALSHASSPTSPTASPTTTVTTTTVTTTTTATIATTVVATSTPIPPPPPLLQSSPKIFDIILFNTELDILELRFNELFHVVDTFVIIEFNFTFSRHPKKLYFKENLQRFEKFRHMIHHIELPPMSAEEADLRDGWGIEHFTRNKGVEIAVKELQPREGDWLHLSDLDEIPRPAILLAMKYPEQGTEISSMFLDRPASEGAFDLFRFGCRFYYYSYEYYKGTWMGPVAMRFRERESRLARIRIDGSESRALRTQKELLATIGVDDQWTGLGSNMRLARFDESAVMVNDACWHCSWCFSNISQVIEKAQSYSHQDHNRDKYQSQEWILDHYRRGEDLFDRQSETFTLIPRNYDIPDHVRFNRHKYRYMLERYQALNAGFVDVTKAPPLAATATATTGVKEPKKETKATAAKFATRRKSKPKATSLPDEGVTKRQ
ncbi:hypothetical protein CPB97_006844 [Podila verticillata]|nr:hypothetical protein CPB97_006844 [Podila verticillata]